MNTVLMARHKRADILDTYEKRRCQRVMHGDVKANYQDIPYKTVSIHIPIKDIFPIGGSTVGGSSVVLALIVLPRPGVLVWTQLDIGCAYLYNDLREVPVRPAVCHPSALVCVTRSAIPRYS